jgi:4-hydroxy-4-methyl-2-oxoglutarate aldolase
MLPRRPKLDLDRIASQTYAAVYSDVCDAAGMRFQTPEPGARLLAGPKKVLLGWARTAVTRPVTAIPARPYGHEIDFIDSLGVGDVVVLDCSQKPAAAWGELFSTASVGRGARGALIDGYIRDAAKIDELAHFPVFGRGTRPTDSLGRVSLAEYDVPVCVYGMTIMPGDFVICDADGVAVVPGDRAEEIIARAQEKAMMENHARDLLLKGGYLRDVWEKYRVL